MAVYRLHRKEWEKGNRPLGKKRARADEGAKGEGEDGEDSVATLREFPGGGRKGISSGLTTVVRRGSNSGGEKVKWWKELATGLKGSK